VSAGVVRVNHGPGASALVWHLAELGLGHAADVDAVCRLYHVPRKDETVRGACREDAVDARAAAGCRRVARFAEAEDEADPAHDDLVGIVAVLLLVTTAGRQRRDGGRLRA
jgi:hypothetical protein